MTAFSITTAIDYVNAAPHLGHAYEKIATDVMARFQRLIGNEVFFLTGTDEHGTKVAETAAKQGLEPKAYADKIADDFKDTWAFLNISYDRFIRTTDAQHYDVVSTIWQRLLDKGDIYKASYTGNYCAGCESFLSDRDLDEDGACKTHQVAPKPVEEENYFFKLTAYKDQLYDLVANKGLVKPDFRAQEVLKILEDLQDISVSRPTHSVSWGIPVPNDPNQTIYVWIDALSNYITGMDCCKDETQFKKFWPADCHMIGKDILRFHALYWPAILLSADLPVPKTIFAHGFINLNDNKISKSLGNVVSPQQLAERFELTNPDPIRYYLMTVCVFGQDGNFTEEDFKTRINADLANNLGNLLNRTLNMTNKYLDGVIPGLNGQSSIDILKSSDDVRISYEAVSQADLNAIAEAIEAYQFQKAAELIVSLVDKGNRIINGTEPWNLSKEGRQEDLEQVLYTVLDILRQVAILLSPITPTLSANIFEQLGYETDTLENQTWADVLETPLPAGQKINLQGPILPRLEDDIAGADAKKSGKKTIKA